MVTLRRLAQTQHDQKARPPSWEPPNYSWSRGGLHVEEGIGDLLVAVVGIGDLLFLDTKAPTSTAAADQAKQ